MSFEEWLKEAKASSTDRRRWDWYAGDFIACSAWQAAQTERAAEVEQLRAERHKWKCEAETGRVICAELRRQSETQSGELIERLKRAEAERDTLRQHCAKLEGLLADPSPLNEAEIALWQQRYEKVCQQITAKDEALKLAQPYLPGCLCWMEEGELCQGCKIRSAIDAALKVGATTTESK